MKYAKRLLRNLDSIREGVTIWVMGWAFVFALGIGWACREIYDEWTVHQGTYD